MTTTRKELVWDIKKSLFKLSSADIYKLARDIAGDNKDTAKLSPDHEENCMDYVVSYIQSDSLRESDDEGMGQLMMLSDLICRILNPCIVGDLSDDEACEVVTHVSPSSPHSPSNNTTTQKQHQPCTHANTNTQSARELRKLYEELGEQLKRCEATNTPPVSVYNHQGTSMPHPMSQRTERMVPLKDLPYLQRREYKVYGGQIGDQSSEIGYNSLSKQIDEGVREGFAEAEVIRGVLRIIKPGTFKEMLINNDEMTILELKGFLRSHLGEKATTEMFQELMCARQLEQESPQQFSVPHDWTKTEA